MENGRRQVGEGGVREEVGYRGGCRNEPAALQGTMRVEGCCGWGWIFTNILALKAMFHEHMQT